MSHYRIEYESLIGNIIKLRRQTGNIIRSIFNLMLPLTSIKGILPKINLHECVTKRLDSSTSLIIRASSNVILRISKVIFLKSRQ